MRSKNCFFPRNWTTAMVWLVVSLHVWPCSKVPKPETTQLEVSPSWVNWQSQPTLTRWWCLRTVVMATHVANHMATHFLITCSTLSNASESAMTNSSWTLSMSNKHDRCSFQLILWVYLILAIQVCTIFRSWCRWRSWVYQFIIQKLFLSFGQRWSHSWSSPSLFVCIYHT